MASVDRKVVDLELTPMRLVEADGERRTMWHQLIPNGQILSWKLLWRALRATVPDSCYHRGRSVVHARPDDHGTTITFADGTRTRFDMVIGADGYRSRICRLIHFARSC